MNGVSARFLAVSVLVSPTSPAGAYEITTHALITSKAFDASVLNPSDPKTIVPALGFDRLDMDYPFSYLGTSSSTPYRDEVAAANPADHVPVYGADYDRSIQEQERKVFNTLTNRGYLSTSEGGENRVRAWLMRGAIREDDNDGRFLGFWFTGDARDPDPFGNTPRATRHFYDPVYDRAYDYPSTCAEYTCVRSVVWAIGRTDPLHPAADADDTTRRNHFTWQDSRNNLWWALTLKRDVASDGYDFGDAVRDGDERTIRMATAIKALGHVIHLLEDTAQPQHVRNDAHAPPAVVYLIAPSEGTTDAAYEAYTDYRVVRDFDLATEPQASGNPLRRMVGGDLPTLNNLATVRLGVGNTYPGGGASVQFSTAAKFFSTNAVETGTDVGSLRSRRGLADMSNRNFFSSATLPGFRECQPAGMPGCVPTVGPTYPLPINDMVDASYTRVPTSTGLGLRVRDRLVYTAEFTQPLSDAVAPTYDQSIGSLAAYGGKVPLVTESIWQDLIPDSLGSYREELGTTLTYNNMRYMADVMLPRAVGYSAGLINHFFRGRLEVSPIDQDMVAVLNQGEPHTVDGSGYPRKTASPAQVFGFEKVRLRVRNTTEDISESGTGAIVPQSTGGAGARLVAVARYHRNECYAQDLSGERTKDFSGAVAEPTCSGRSARSVIQEISVSATLTVAPGELDTATPIEKLFDFSSDPIPVNATDLFITVAYRGKLGDEADGIALGTYDVSEPTFVSFWNNTDYFWNGINYLGQNGTYPLRNVYSFYACAGVPSKWLYRYGGSTGALAMGFPPPPPGHIRLALVVGRPDNASQRFPIRAVPIMQTSPHASMRSSATRGQYRQASKEIVAPSVLATPYTNCFLNPPPANVDTWCSDPVQKRRGLRWGDVAQPIYWSIAAVGDGPDVDSVPLPVFVSANLRDGGEIKFNDAGALQSCPAQPTLLLEEQERVEARELEALSGSGH